MRSVSDIFDGDKICDYRRNVVMQAYNIPEHHELLLLSDGQNQEFDDTYFFKDTSWFPVQLWMMVLSPKHVGNPKSSVDFLISCWKENLGKPNSMEPKL